jgi:hypothetical protein
MQCSAHSRRVKRQSISARRGTEESRRRTSREVERGEDTVDGWNPSQQQDQRSRDTSPLAKSIGQTHACEYIDSDTDATEGHCVSRVPPCWHTRARVLTRCCPRRTVPLVDATARSPLRSRVDPLTRASLSSIYGRAHYIRSLALSSRVVRSTAAECASIARAPLPPSIVASRCSSSPRSSPRRRRHIITSAISTDDRYDARHDRGSAAAPSRQQTRTRTR